jgi:hypothetical protein
MIGQQAMHMPSPSQDGLLYCCAGRRMAEITLDSVHNV